MSLNPLPSPTDSSDLIITVPPITQDARTEAASQASQRGEGALFALREARGAHKKKLRQWELGRKVSPDALRRGEKEMEQINERAGTQAKKMVEETKKRLLGQ